MARATTGWLHSVRIIGSRAPRCAGGPDSSPSTPCWLKVESFGFRNEIPGVQCVRLGESSTLLEHGRRLISHAAAMPAKQPSGSPSRGAPSASRLGHACPRCRNKLAGLRQPRSCLCLADDAALEWPKPVSCKLVAHPCRPLAPGARVLRWCTRRGRASPEPRPVHTHLAPAGSPPIGWLSVPTASLRLCPRPRAVFLRVVPVSWVCVTAVGSNRPGIYRRRGIRAGTETATGHPRGLALPSGCGVGAQQTSQFAPRSF